MTPDDRRPEIREIHPMGPVLLCDDGSAAARAAMATAARLLAPAPAVVVHAGLPPSRVVLWTPLIESPGPLVEAAAELDAPGREAAEQLVREGAAVATAAGFDATPRVEAREHGAWRTILRAAEQLDARLIVLGSHGRSPVGSRILGSVATGVSHHSTRPLLIVPLAVAE